MVCGNSYGEVRAQENMLKGGLNGRNARGRQARTRAVKGIEGDIKLNGALWVLAKNIFNFNK